jgi:hypothetical protein
VAASIASDPKSVLHNSFKQLVEPVVLQQAMRHSSPETKRHYQLSMTQVIREMIERANE